MRTTNDFDVAYQKANGIHFAKQIALRKPKYGERDGYLQIRAQQVTNEPFVLRKPIYPCTNQFEQLFFRARKSPTLEPVCFVICALISMKFYYGLFSYCRFGKREAVGFYISSAIRCLAPSHRGTREYVVSLLVEWEPSPTKTDLHAIMSLPEHNGIIKTIVSCQEDVIRKKIHVLCNRHTTRVNNGCLRKGGSEITVIVWGLLCKCCDQVDCFREVINWTLVFHDGVDFRGCWNGFLRQESSFRL
ncbi:hypothetical protein Tco_0517448 [Tanacetum coccineum]